MLFTFLGFSLAGCILGRFLGFCVHITDVTFFTPTAVACLALSAG